MFVRTLEINSRYRSALYNLGALFYHQRRYQEAVSKLERLSELYPSYLDGVHMLGDAYMQSKQPGKARLAYELVLSQDPDHLVSLHNLGEFLIFFFF